MDREERYGIVSLSVLLMATVLALPLPRFSTVPTPFLELGAVTRNPFSVGGDAIAADITTPRSEGGIVLWRNGTRVAMPPIAPNAEFGSPTAFLTQGAIAYDGTLFAMRGTPFSGAYSGIAFDAFRLNGTQWSPVSTAGCAVGDSVAHIDGVENDGSFDLTFESPTLINFDTARTGAYAPYAARLINGRCRIFGRFNLRDVNGDYAVGYRGYLDNVLAPTNLNLPQQRYTAVRYCRGKVTELGPGEAFAVAPDGVAAGSTAPTMSGEFMVDNAGNYHKYQCCTPHAVLWDAAGHTTSLAPHSPVSVAYDIDASHRVIGTMLGRDGRHYAFLWQRGHLHLLDELLHASGWRFEGAYRFLPGGSIAGIGTYKGVATAFVARSSP